MIFTKTIAICCKNQTNYTKDCAGEILFCVVKAVVHMVTTTTWTAKVLSFVTKVWNTSSACLLEVLYGKTTLR